MKNLNDDLLELVEKFTYSIFNSEDIIEDLQSLGYTENKYSFSEYPSIIIYLSFIYKNKNFNFDDLKILTELCNYIEKLINEIKNTKYIDISLCYGLTGIAYCLKYTFYKTGKFQNILLNIEKTLVDLVNQKLDEVLQIKDTVYESDYDVIEGLASPALYLMDCENNDYHDTIERLLRYFVLLLSRKDNSIHALITPEKMVTENLSKKYPNGYINLSLSHGIASILYILAFAQVRGFNVYKLRESVEFGLKLYMDSIVEYKLNGKNYKFFSSRLLLPNNKLETANNLSWCYGSLGIINILFDIAELHNDSNIMGSLKNIAKELSEIDNLNMMNNSICHGYAGVILILNKLYRKTGIKALKEKSDKMYYQVLESMDSSKYIFTEKDIYFRGEIFDEEVEYVDYSLLSGNVGIVLSLLNHKYNIDSLIGRMLFI